MGMTGARPVLECAACGDKPVSRRTLVNDDRTPRNAMAPICRDCLRLSTFKWESACYEMMLLRRAVRLEMKR